ncbi:hypothetical protein TPELB_24490 [Terrisporobacter petrolearius]|uniref:Uncharacterized protein n=1 Tax=Terrisporobacter petrolearius TaxID=1460447 RepID=A0ABZ3FFZ7_9FIRM
MNTTTFLEILTVAEKLEVNKYNEVKTKESM